MVRVADYIMSRLYAEGINHVFTVTGRGALFLSDALAAHKEIQSISVHHEQAASFAAAAYADYTGKPGVCLVSTGCAGTNALTGVLNAWQDGHACIFISGQNKLEETSRYTGIPLRTYGQQEADIIPIVQPITKYATMLTDAKRIVFELEKALFLAQEGRKGPVWIDIPLDVQNMRIRPEEMERFTPPTPPIYNVDDEASSIANSLNTASRPVILIGSGIRSADAIAELEALLTKTSIPLVNAASAPDTFGTVNDLSIGTVGAMGSSRAANFTVQNADILLVLGSRLNSMTTGEFCKFAREARVIVVDIDSVEHSKKGARIDHLVIADVKLMLEELNKKDIKKTDSSWINKVLHWKKIFPKCEEKYKKTEKIDLYYLAETLSKTLPDNASLMTDSGLIELIIPTNVSFNKNQRAIHPASQGCMGYALPALIGSHFASNKPVVTVVGDGSIMMNLQELATISYHKIPAKIIVVNNNAYAVIRKRQIELFGSRTIGTDASNGVGCPDFKKVAAAFDIPHVLVERATELESALTKLFATDGPVICEVMGLENQDYIASSHVRDSKKRIVIRPIEDQQPFLDRELFLSEMIVTPVDQ